MYTDSILPSLQRNYSDLMPIGGFCQRLKGKNGQFRSNLLKRGVELSERTAISPESNLSINPVAVLTLVSRDLTYLERVPQYSTHNLQQLVQNEPDPWPDANYIIKKDNHPKLWLNLPDRQHVAEAFVEWDMVGRHLGEGTLYYLINSLPCMD